jgi:aspartate aminotransferase
MNHRISDRLANMEESATLRMAQLAREQKAKGRPIISLSLGEPDFDTPEHIKKAAVKALEEGYTKYTPVPGLIELREAICHKFKRDNNLVFKPSQIVVSNGAKQSIANLSMSLLQEGDEAIIFSPYWVSYKEIIGLSGASCNFVHAGIDQDYKVSPAQLEAAIKPNTRLVLFSSPCNPTGSLYSQEELNALAKVLEKHPDIVVVSDEIYEYINFTDQAHASIAHAPNFEDRVVIVNGFSKGFAMTGWRLGYMAAPQWIADACIKMQGQFTSGANAFGQKAAADALMADLGPTMEMTAAFKKRRDIFVKALSEIDGFKVNQPEGAFYIFPDISAFIGKSDGETTINNDEDLVLYILFNADVALVAGSAFGAENCLRLSYALGEEDLLEAARRIKEAVSKLN